MSRSRPPGPWPATACSRHARQPWRVVREPERDVFHFHLCRSRGYDRLIKAVDLQRIDLGIAFGHFELAARELGANRSVILHYANSGDVTGDRRQVVGYLSAALIKTP